jgi:inosine-uridine nucleoside N-ribohydrolase
MNKMTITEFRSLILSEGVKNVILDTDAYNEIDDQFCIAYMIKRPDKINLLSINAAPFFNENSTGAEDGMEKSYDEILKLQALMGSDVPTYRGSRAFLKDRNTPEDSDACDNIINTVMNTDERVIIVAIGAITNVASAILKCPEIVDRAGIIWLGGHAHHLPSYPGNEVEFNLRGDISAAQVVFDSKIPLLQVPCRGVCSAVSTTSFELEHYLRGRGAVCDYLVDNVTEVTRGLYAKSRVIWDITTATPLIAPDGCKITELPAPVILDDGTYAISPTRHTILYVYQLRRDPIFADLFRSLTGER